MKLRWRHLSQPGNREILMSISQQDLKVARDLKDRRVFREYKEYKEYKE